MVWWCRHWQGNYILKLRMLFIFRSDVEVKKKDLTNKTEVSKIYRYHNIQSVWLKHFDWNLWTSLVGKGSISLLLDWLVFFFLQIYQTSNDCCPKEDGCCLCIPARVLIVVVYKTKVVVFKTTCAWLVSSAQCGRCFQDQEALAVSPSLSPRTFPWTFRYQEALVWCVLRNLSLSVSLSVNIVHLIKICLLNDNIDSSVDLCSHIDSCAVMVQQLTGHGGEGAASFNSQRWMVTIQNCWKASKSVKWPWECT